MKKTKLPSPKRMYRALCERDASYEGKFLFGVKTTGIFCRPICRSKIPKPENVVYFSRAGEAKKAGFRACLRCKPEAALPPEPSLVPKLKKEIQRAPGGRVTEKELAAQGIDPSTARRQFKRAHGTTFQAWAKGRRLVETAIPTPLGDMVAVADAAGLRLLVYADFPKLASWKAEVQATLGAVIVPGTHPHLTTLKRELTAYFAGKKNGFTVPLAPLGTPFRDTVWKKLLAVPFGKATTYAGLAASAGKPKAARGVGNAVGANRLIVVVPCHRVLGSGGALGGFSAGIERKKWLLAHEGVKVGGPTS